MNGDKTCKSIKYKDKIIIGCLDGYIYVCSVNDNQLQATKLETVHTMYINSLFVNNDVLVSDCGNKITCCWDIDKLTLIDAVGSAYYIKERLMVINV